LEANIPIFYIFFSGNIKWDADKLNLTN